jgi:hypothetical protein
LEFFSYGAYEKNPKQGHLKNLLWILKIIFIAVNANPSPLDHVIRLYFVYIFLLIIDQASKPLLPLS